MKINSKFVKLLVPTSLLLTPVLTPFLYPSLGTKEEKCKEKEGFQQLDKYKRVVIIGIDGIGRFSKNANVPTLDKLASSGVSSFYVRGVKPTESGPNWGSMLFGVFPERHGFTNTFLESGLRNGGDNDYPSIFKVLKKNYPNVKMASFASWELFNSLIETPIAHSSEFYLYSPMTHENIFWRWWLRSIRHHFLKSSIYDHTLVPKLINYITDPKNNDVKLLFVHLTDTDEWGHDYDFGSQQHLKQIEIADSHLAKIIQAVEKAGWKKDSLLIITTDHGGFDRQHSKNTSKETESFLIICGKDIVPGSRIEGKIQRKGELLYNMDVAAITLKALGVEIPSNFDAELPFGVFNQEKKNIEEVVQQLEVKIEVPPKSN